jgi:hypothetical protein
MSPSFQNCSWGTRKKLNNLSPFDSNYPAFVTISSASFEKYPLSAITSLPIKNPTTRLSHGVLRFFIDFSFFEMPKNQSIPKSIYSAVSLDIKMGETRSEFFLNPEESIPEFKDLSIKK